MTSITTTTTAPATGRSPAEWLARKQADVDLSTRVHAAGDARMA